MIKFAQKIDMRSRKKMTEYDGSVFSVFSRCDDTLAAVIEVINVVGAVIRCCFEFPHLKSQPFFFARKAGGRDTKRADVVMYADSDTKNGHDKARWVHLWSVHGYTVNKLLMYPPP